MRKEAIAMPEVLFNAFSFLQNKLRQKGIPYTDVPMTLAPGSRARDLLESVQLHPDDVEAVFINGRVSPMDTLLNDNDRVAFVPPGTPGPYRVLLGFMGQRKP